MLEEIRKFRETIGPIEWQCGSNADGIASSRRGWIVTQIGGIGVHAQLL